MPEMYTPSVSLVIPMFNEEENIEHAVDAAVEALTKYTDDYEIVIVDDASSDSSPMLVARRVAENPRIRMIRHEKNRKLGGALKSGFAAATKDLVLYMDADLPFDPDVLGRAMRAMQVTGADVIAGYRLDRTIEGPKRTLYSYVYNALIGVLFGWPHRDINFSFKLMKREVIEAIDLKAEGSLIDAELIVKAKNRGFAIQQIGLDYFPRIRGQSHLSSPRVILKIFAELVKLYPEMRRRTPRPRTGAARADREGAGHRAARHASQWPSTSASAATHLARGVTPGGRIPHRLRPRRSRCRRPRAPSADGDAEFPLEAGQEDHRSSRGRALDGGAGGAASGARKRNHGARDAPGHRREQLCALEIRLGNRDSGALRSEGARSDSGARNSADKTI